MKTFIFFHIPKTAGSSFRHSLKSLYGQENVAFVYDKQNRIEALSQAVESKVDAICGHISWDVFRASGLHLSDFETFTFLRQPDDQVVSHFLHKMREKKWKHSKEIFPDFEEFLKSPWGQNWQTRFLSGFSKEEWTQTDDKELFHQARKHLLAINTVGLTEAYSKTMKLLRFKLGWRKLQEEKRNITNDSHTAHVIKKTFADEIKRMNLLDIELYQLAQKRFNDDYNQLPFWKKF